MALLSYLGFKVALLLSVVSDGKAHSPTGYSMSVESTFQNFSTEQLLREQLMRSDSVQEYCNFAIHSSIGPVCTSPLEFAHRQTYMHTYIYIYIHTYTHTHIYEYICTDIHTYR